MAQDSKLFSRRLFTMALLQLGALGVLGGRMAWLQIANGEQYRMLSDKNRINIKMLPPSRGRIFDRFGIPLAVNARTFRLLVVPEQVDSLEYTLRQASKHIDIPPHVIERVIEQSKKISKFVPLEIRDNLAWEEVAKIEVRLPDFPGLFIDTGEVRSYPHGEASAHVIGYVSAVSPGELDRDPVLRLPGMKIGKTGIEKAYDDRMRGEAGRSEVEVNVVGREVRELARHPSQSGEDIVLTLDSGLQQFVQTRLQSEKSASAVIMDVHTGAVYALASHPGFDPNMFTHGLSAEQWEALLANPAHPLTNKAIAGQYPPASTFKMITALAGLKAGLIKPGDGVRCSGHYDFGGDRFHCWKRGGHGWVNAVQAIEESCDTFFYDLATRLHIDDLAAAARDFGLGQTLGFELSEERPGLIPGSDWKMGHLGESWKRGETIVASIGQGYLQATPLQMAVMTARLVNGGYAVRPWISLRGGPQGQKIWPRLPVTEDHLGLIKKGMDAAVNNPDGTAYGARIEKAAFAMGGKTGTAQVKKITMEQRLSGIRMEDLPWRSRHHGLFVGYAPYDKPRYACAVVVEHGIGGSVSAAPIARDILLAAQKRNSGRPSTALEKLSAVSGNGPNRVKL